MEGQISKFYPGFQSGLRLRMNVFFQNRDNAAEPRAICTTKQCHLIRKKGTDKYALRLYKNIFELST